MRPIRPGAADSVNQSAPSGPAAMPSGFEFMVRPALNFMTSPVVEIRPMPPGSAVSVNQSLPSGPAAMSAGSSLPDRLLLNSVITPALVIAPILPVSSSVNQSLLSGPLTIEVGSAPSLRPSVNSVIEPVGRDPADHVRDGIHVPEVAVGADRDVVRIAGRGNGELGDVARLRHARDRAVAAGLGDPEVAVRAA